MKKIKVIDLLNKIANKEKVSKCIRYQGNYYYNVGDEEQVYYENPEIDDNLFLYAVYNESHLNDLVEIIEDTPKEDKKIEKLVGESEGININYSKINIIDKINEIIDKVNGE